MWRIARIIPIPKTKDPKSFAHYRPISILPFFSKVLERIVFQQLNQYLLDNHILSKFQSGFRNGHSTVTILIKFVTISDLTWTYKILLSLLCWTLVTPLIPLIMIS